MAVVALIPARGGSKGVLRKNLQFVGGRTLLARSIGTAQRCPDVTAVVVTTDDSEIAAEAKRHGATVVTRPDELATDEASSEAAILHALDTLDLGRDESGDVVAFLQCTSPFTTPDDIGQVLGPVLAGRADVAFAVMPFHGFLWKPGPDGQAVAVNHDASVRHRRQDRPAEFMETGAVYAMEAFGFRQARHRFFGRVVPIVLDPRRALEVDTPADLALARCLAADLDHEVAIVDRAPRLVVLDFDGVVTDNRVIVHEDGHEAVIADRGDGHGLSRLREVVPIVVLSTEVNPVVAARCDKLGLPCIQGLGSRKFEALERYASDLGIGLGDVLYVGNDINDLECLTAVGMPVVVADAVPAAKETAWLVLTQRGGRGALRELAELLLPLYETAGAEERQ